MWAEGMHSLFYNRALWSDPEQQHSTGNKTLSNTKTKIKPTKPLKLNGHQTESDFNENIGKLLKGVVCYPDQAHPGSRTS